MYIFNKALMLGIIRDFNI